MDVAKSQLALVQYADGLLTEGQRVRVGRPGSDVGYQLQSIMISDEGIVCARLIGGHELYLAPGQLAWVMNDPA